MRRFLLKFIAIYFIALLLSACSPETVFIPAACYMEDANWSIEPSGDDLYITLELLGVDCDT